MAVSSSSSTSPSHRWSQDEDANEEDYQKVRLLFTDDDGDRDRDHASPRSIWPRKSSLRLPRSRKVRVALLVMDVIITALVVHAFSPLITLLQRNEELFGARLTFSQDSQHELPAGPQTIPRILHQTTANETVPEKWLQSQKTCKDAYSDYEYKLWTDASARDLIRDKYSWFLETWDNLPFNIQRADALRYFVLHYYGGMYIDMDTLCADPIPMDQLEADGEKHHAVFKSTTPTGVSNDLMITSPGHPVFAAALAVIKPYNDFCMPWARWAPYVAIMVGSGPMFITMAIKNYLIENPGLAPTDVQVINATSLTPYITDLEAASWHQGDAKVIMFLGERPWIWYALGAVGLVIGLYIINLLTVAMWRGLRGVPSVLRGSKEHAGKLT